MADDSQSFGITDMSSDAASDTTDETSTTNDTTTGTTHDTSDSTRGTETDKSSFTDGELSELTQSDTEEGDKDLDVTGCLLPEDILCFDDGRHVRAEEDNWAQCAVPDLADIVIEAARDIKGPELKNLMEKASTEQRKRILELIPLNIPQKFSLDVLGNGRYWERQCLERFSLSEIWRYHDDWKVMFVELSVESSIENFVPGASDIEQLKELLTTFQEYNHRLKISHLQKSEKESLKVDLASENFDDHLDDFLAKPVSSANLIDFEVVLSLLSELKELTLTLTPSSLDSEELRVSVPDFNSLLRGLKNLRKLEKFRCSNAAFPNDQLKIFCCTFLDHNLLKELDLSCNFIDDECCGFIGKLLASSCPLETLVLKYNRIADEGAVAIASVLAVNKNLKKLDLSLNWIGEDGGEFLAKAVSRNATIEDLDVSKNKFGARAGMSFGDMVMVSKSIISLNISENNIGKKSGRKIAEALQVNKTILNLNVLFCDMSPEDEDIVYNLISRNRYEENDADYEFRNKATAVFIV